MNQDGAQRKQVEVNGRSLPVTSMADVHAASGRKTCVRCGSLRSLIQFSKIADGRGGLASTCMPCEGSLEEAAAVRATEDTRRQEKDTELLNETIDVGPGRAEACLGLDQAMVFAVSVGEAIKEIDAKGFLSFERRTSLVNFLKRVEEFEAKQARTAPISLPNVPPVVAKPSRKRCYCCKAEKPLSGFTRDRQKTLGHSGICKDCKNAKQNEKRANIQKSKLVSAVAPEPVRLEKKCTKCGEVKPLSAFHRAKRGRGGRQAWCAICACAYSQKWHASMHSNARSWLEKSTAAAAPTGVTSPRYLAVAALIAGGAGIVFLLTQILQ